MKKEPNKRWSRTAAAILRSRTAPVVRATFTLENASLEEIAEELRIMGAVRRGRSDVAAGRTKTHGEVEDLLESWATAWTLK